MVIPILGPASYYAGTFIAGLVLGIVIELLGGRTIETIDKFTLSIISIPFGILFCYGLYRMLQNKWEKELSTNSNQNSADEL